MYGRTTRGSPSLGSMMPSRERMLGWWKPFMMRPSRRNWSTSPRSVIPVDTKDRTRRKRLMRTSSDYSRTMNYAMERTVEGFYGTVGLLVVAVDQESMINRPKVACVAVMNTAEFDSFRLSRNTKRDKCSRLPLPIIWLSSIRSISAGIRTFLTSSRSSGLKLTLSRVMRGTDRRS